MEVINNTDKSSFSKVEPKRMGRGERETNEHRHLFRMVYYKEQRNKAVTRGTFGSRKRVFPHGKKVHVVVLCRMSQ